MACSEAVSASSCGLDGAQATMRLRKSSSESIATSPTCKQRVEARRKIWSSFLFWPGDLVFRSGAWQQQKNKIGLESSELRTLSAERLWETWNSSGSCDAAGQRKPQTPLPSQWGTLRAIENQ